MTAPITRTAEGLDLSPRFVESKAITGSPSGATETVVCTSPVFPAGYDATVVTAVLIVAQVAYTVAGSGVSARYRIRQGTGTSGTVVFDSGVTTAGITAANLVIENMIALDTSAGSLSGQQYVLTLAVGSGSGASTVSAAAICALAV